MKTIDYWRECLSVALDESGKEIDVNTLNILAEAAEAGHENYSMAYYSPPSSEIYGPVIASLKRELEKERDKRLCVECRGTGSITFHGPHHSAYSLCWKCNGEGRK